MRLKSVRIFGFKTFADRTEFSLEGGIVAVVGPNGCGKSNLVDAILWGLGEGNARHLRAQAGQDVIFNGSAKRKGVGFCEVTLLFDNEDGLLPVPSPEVAVARRLTRSGDSEYSINRRGCRQKDIYELLADSGLGRTGYSIVGQKQIDAALSASSEDRRAWIDEAAGVQRFRQRKQEATRKLEAAKDHLRRISDILGELNDQREPLRAQAEQAIEYRRIQSALRRTEINLLGSEINAATGELDRLRAEIDRGSLYMESQTLKAILFETKAREIQAEIEALDKLIEEERTRAEAVRSRALNFESSIRLAESKLESLAAQEAEFEANGLEISLRLEEAEAEIDRMTLELQNEQDYWDEVKEATAGHGEETRSLTLALDEAERQLKAASQREAQRHRRIADRENLLEKRELARRELESLLRTLPDLEESAESARAGMEEHSVSLAALKESAQKAIAAELTVKSEEDQEARKVRALLSERASLEGRERGIEATIDSLEGMNQGSRAVLEAAARGQIEGSFVSVGQAIQTPREFALAIETALGNSVNDLIVDTERDAKEAIEYLKTHRAGRATFQPIPLMRRLETSSFASDLANRSGVKGMANELVTCEAKFRSVIDSLLGRVLIVDNLSTALKLAKTKGWSRIATLEGEIVHGSGAVTGGVQSRQPYGVLQKKSDLATIRQQREKASQQIEEFYRESKQREQKALEAAAQLKRLREEIAAKEELLVESKSFARSLQDELRSTLKEKFKLEAELGKEIPVEDAPAEDLAGWEQRRNQALHALAAKSADAQIGEERLRDAKKRLEQARLRLETAIRRREGALQSERSRNARIKGVQPEKERLAGQIQEDRKGREEALAEEESSRQSMRFLQALRDGRIEEMVGETEQAAACRQSVADTGNMLHQAEIQRTKMEARRFNSLARLGEEYSITEGELSDLNLEPPDPEAATLVARLRRELRAMGDVNLGAIEAFERLSERYDSLKVQSDDVLGGIEEVERSIRELDQLTREKFLTTFAELQKKFSQTFDQVFPGGLGAIGLSNPEDVLGSGIDIEVTLPGKRRQTLSLLSGGEQSLCTAALLFSLLQVKPSPLVVLDEVDAPLDGRNVERYAALLKDLSQSMQFIVITHNPVTIEAATTWLGVTMQEPGVSTLLPTNPPGALQISAKTA